jgi:hypothetical protein
LLALASGDDEGALRLALLGYVRGVGEAPPTTERADATRWANLAAIDAAPPDIQARTMFRSGGESGKGGRRQPVTSAKREASLMGLLPIGPGSAVPAQPTAGTPSDPGSTSILLTYEGWLVVSGSSGRPIGSAGCDEAPRSRLHLREDHARRDNR